MSYENISYMIFSKLAIKLYVKYIESFSHIDYKIINITIQEQDFKF